MEKQTILLENKNYLKICGVESIINLNETDVAIMICGEVLVIKVTDIKADK